MRSSDVLRRGGTLAVCCSALLASGCGDRRTPEDRDALLEVLKLEDARPTDATRRNALVELTRDENPATRRFAVRALGRLEDPALVPAIVPLLSDPDAEVRAQAAWASAQATHGQDGTAALAPVLQAARTEAVPAVRGAMAHALGRLRPDGIAPEGVVPLLADWAASEGLPPETALGVALGLEALTRAPGSAGAQDALVTSLDRLASYTASGASAATIGQIRAVALLGLGQRGQLSEPTLRLGLASGEDRVRTFAARYVRALPEPDRSAQLLGLLADPAPTVRVEAVRVLQASERTVEHCNALLDAAGTDPVGGVRWVALEALGEPCPDPASQVIVGYLDSLASTVSAESERGWELPSQALAALARLEPGRAQAVLPSHVTHRSPFARAAAAAVAARLSDTSSLRALVSDPDANVRTAALPALFAVEGRALDPTLLEQLGSDDGQLLITAAGLLDGTRSEAAAPTAIAAFDRISALRRETARDPRMALLGLIRSTGSSELAGRLEPYLPDYDAVVAREVASMLQSWTGQARPARPTPLPRLALPTPEELALMESSVVVLHMARGGEVVIELLPLLAPTNAHRFVRLAREGYFDGLTFHRVVPNFVVQGGSPSANEYAGDGPYTRDEIGRISHWRGTVGISTRGRDTGDGQIFVNLVDNVRLDHDYTIFGAIVSGMDTVDSVLAGHVIERVEIRPQD